MRDSVNGQKTGDGNLVLQPFEHRPRLLSEIVPGLQPQVGGYIRVTSDPGVFTFELFLFVPSGKVLSMSAVPPQRGHGTILGKITPASVSTSSLQATEKSEFEASRAKGIYLDLNAEFVPRELIVKFHPDFLSTNLFAFARKYGLHVLAQGSEGTLLLSSGDWTGFSPLGTQSETQLQILDLKRQTLAVIEEVNADPIVLYAEPNYIYRHQAIPNDPDYRLQWHYSSINLPGAWDITKGDANVVIAVIDGGAKFNHPDLGPRLTGGQFDFIRDPLMALDGDGIDPSADDPGSDPFGLFSSFHGTHVAGTIGAVTNNGVGVAGVNWNSPLMILRALGKGGEGTCLDISEAIRYAAGLPNRSGQVPARKAKVINMSLRGDFSQSIAEAVAAAQAQNVVIVAAAGNDSSPLFYYPASYDGVISVGATDLSGDKAWYSNFGSRIDVVAPGGDSGQDINGDFLPDGVYSTHWWEFLNLSEGPNYSHLQGTSMAAPHVTGIVSLILSVNPNLTPAQVRQILQQTAVDLGEPGRDDIFGFGLVNPVAALQAAGAQTSSNPSLAVSTTKMDFGRSLTQITATISNGGGGTLRLDPPKVETDKGSGWLSLILSNPLSALTARVDRTNLATGLYTGRILLTSNGGSATIEVMMEVGEETRTDIGQISVLAIDPVTFKTIDGTSTESAIDYKFLIPPVASGNYFLVAGTDSDGDGFICDEGEFCGIYPVTNEPGLVRVKANEVTRDINFTVEKNALQQSAAKSEGPIRAFRLPGAKGKAPNLFNGPRAAAKPVSVPVPQVSSPATQMRESSSQ